MNAPHSVYVNGKKYPYHLVLDEKDPEMCFFECQGARLSQYYPCEDIPSLLTDLPGLILDEIAYQRELKRGETKLYFRVKADEKKIIQKKARAAGFATTSEYLRSLALG